MKSSVDPRLLAFVQRMSAADYDKLASEAGDMDFYKFVVARALDKDVRDVTSDERMFVKLALFRHVYSSRDFIKAIKETGA